MDNTSNLFTMETVISISISEYPDRMLSSPMPIPFTEHIHNNVSAVNETHNISSNVSDTTDFIMSATKALYTYAVPFICVMGIAGGAVSFFIFVFTSFRYQPCSQYLAALSFVDTLFLISQLISSLMTYFPVLTLVPGCCSIVVFISYSCSFLSAWFVVVMMLERYLAVCHPFRLALVGKRQKAVVVIIMLTSFAVFFYVHSFFTTDNTNGPHCQIDEDLYDFLVIFTYVDSFVTFLIPFVLIVALNLRIILTVRKFRLRQSLIRRPSICTSHRYYNSADKTLSLAQVRSTKMLLRVSSVFVCLYLPSYVTRLYGTLVQEFEGDDFEEEAKLRLIVAQQLCQMLYYINFAADFILFSLTSGNFRRHVMRCLRSKAKCGDQYY